jgi:hypothetical protein
MKNIRRFVVAAIFVLLIASVIVCIPRTYKIDKTIHAASFELSADNPAELGPVQVSIKGNHRISLFAQDTFDGEVKIETVSISKEALLKIVFDKKDGFGTLNYQKGSLLEFAGYIKMSDKADNILICIPKDTGQGTKIWSANDGTVIAYPETDFSKIQKHLYAQ